MSKKILFFGNERLATGVSTATPVLKALLAHGYSIEAVVVAQSDTGKSRRSRPLEVAAVAEKHKIPLLSPVDLIQAKDQLAAYGAQAAVLVAYGKIVPPELLKIFPAGIINIHPSLLPLHRGSTPLEGAILSGARETGVSLMKLAQKTDTGPVYAQETLPLSGKESKQALADRLSAIGTDMLLQDLPAILDGSLEPTPQDESGATLDAHISKADGVIDWSKSAGRLEREVRAYAGWPRSRAKLGGTDVIITRATDAEGSGEPGSYRVEGKELGVYCGQGVLVIESLIPAGKKEMTAAAFLAGYKL